MTIEHYNLSTSEGIEARMRNYAAKIADIENGGQLATKRWACLNSFLARITDHTNPENILSAARTLIRKGSDHEVYIGWSLLCAPKVVEQIALTKPFWLSEKTYNEYLPNWRSWRNIPDDSFKAHIIFRVLEQALQMRKFYGKREQNGRAKDRATLYEWSKFIDERTTTSSDWCKGFMFRTIAYWPDMEGTLTKKYFGIKGE